MKLSEKGHYAPPPKLKGAAQRVSETVGAWRDVHARTHWLLGDETQVDGADFYLGQEELGHIHLYSEAHVVLPRAVVDALVKARLGDRFQWSRSIVSFEIGSMADAEHALWLFQLSYDHRRGETSDALLARVHAYARGSFQGRSAVAP